MKIFSRLALFLSLLSGGTLFANERLDELVRVYQTQPRAEQAKQGPKRPFFKPLKEIRVNALDTSMELPEDQSAKLFEPFAGGVHQKNWATLQYHWQPTEFWHHPVYWDYIPWDYYGQWSHPLVQPWLEGVHFFGTFPVLGYKMGLDRPQSRVYTLGHHRPGNSVPRYRHRLPWQWDAAAWESAMWVSAAFIFP